MKATLLLVFIPLLFSCNSNTDNLENASTINDAAIGKEMKLTNTSMAEIDKNGQNQDLLKIEKKLIRNGSLEFKTNDVRQTKLEIEKFCKENNAYISNENENNLNDRIQYNQTIRVPAERFEQLVSKIESLATKVENKNIFIQDVTEEFIDVTARLKTKRELETRYLEILNRANTVEEIISVESQIANVRSEIESMQGRLEYLKNQVTLSTLQISFYETIGTSFGFAGKFNESLKAGWQNLLSFIIVLITLWPFAIALGLSLFIWRRKRNRKNN